MGARWMGMTAAALMVTGQLAAQGGVADEGRASALAPPPEDASWHLWYRQPAQDWNEALPLGNGRLGAMVFGGVGEERLQLNEDTLWTGRPHDYSVPGASAYLPEVRRLLFAGKEAEATALADQPSATCVWHSRATTRAKRTVGNSISATASPACAIASARPSTPASASSPRPTRRSWYGSPRKGRTR